MTSHQDAPTSETPATPAASPAPAAVPAAPAEFILRSHNKREFLVRARTLNKVPLDVVASWDLGLIGSGALAPLTGFMAQAEYDSVVEHMVLPDGTTLGLPVVLSVSEELAKATHVGEEVALVDAAGELRGRMTVTEKFARDKEREARLVFGTAEHAHPGVKVLMALPGWCLAGPIELLEQPKDPRFDALPMTPRQVREEFQRRGWSTIVGFQTRNPIHRAHEYLTKCALEIVDGLLLHPLVGETRGEDIPATVRVACYRALIEKYYPADRVLLAAYPAAMRYAGPREALFHARVRKNYGCTHFIVGRDHAGVGNYYGHYDAQKLLRSFTIERLGLTPLYFDNTFYCQACSEFGSTKTCPHGPTNHLSLSGTRVREMLAKGEALPAEFTRPEVAELLRAHYAEQSQS